MEVYGKSWTRIVRRMNVMSLVHDQMKSTSNCQSAITTHEQDSLSIDGVSFVDDTEPFVNVVYSLLELSIQFLNLDGNM